MSKGLRLSAARAQFYSNPLAVLTLQGVNQYLIDTLYSKEIFSVGDFMRKKAREVVMLIGAPGVESINQGIRKYGFPTSKIKIQRACKKAAKRK